VTGPLAARTVPIDDPGDLLALLPDPGARVWVREGEGLVAWGEAARLPVATCAERFDDAQTALSRLLADVEVDDLVGQPGTGPVAFGTFTFDEAAPGSSLVVPRVVVGRRRGAAWATLVSRPGDAAFGDVAGHARVRPPPPAHDRVRYAGSSLPEVGWLAAVAEAVDEIRGGPLGKVVLARDRKVWARRPFDARLLARRLADRFPACFTFAVDGLVGATPELLIGKDGPALSSLVLAGSAARSDDKAEDAALGEALRASAKDRSEHAPALESVRRVLARYADALVVDDDPWLLRLANVQHLATTVRATLTEPGPTALTLAGRLHPTAAVGGTPTDLALAAIGRLEGMDRGRYAAPVGWVDARGDGEFGIALRCAEVSGATARLFAGAGVVAASRPEAELEETRLKLRAMQSALEESGA
jgi:menaquinone-specific isochorismate synthase